MRAFHVGFYTEKLVFVRKECVLIRGSYVAQDNFKVVNAGPYVTQDNPRVNKRVGPYVAQDCLGVENRGLM